MVIEKSLHVSPEDQARSPYAYIAFEVPSGTTRIDVTLAYPKAENCVIDLGCADPRLTAFPSAEGFRGWSGGARDRFFIATDDATPGYVHGPMPAGTWQVMLGLYKIPETGADVEVAIALDDTPRETVPHPERTAPVRTGAGWYKGDLHCHTHHSDAKGSPETLHAAARQAGLDFLAVTDHNTTTQRRYFHAASDLVFVRGMEITTAIGHANVFGVDDWIDFRLEHEDDPHRLAQAVHARGGLLSINHDKPPIPWDYVVPEIDCMEVWHENWFHYNWVGLARYQERLAAGARLPAIGGSDHHQPLDLQPEGPFTLARPTTVLWLDEVSEAAVLAAMKTGHGYITEAPDGPHLALSVGGTPMGGSVAPAPTGEITVRVETAGAAGDTLTFIDANGEMHRTELTQDREVVERTLAARVFVRCEIVAESSRERLIAEMRDHLARDKCAIHLTDAEIAAQPLRRALSNPIYIDTGAQ